jgi:hypothetical protein
MLICRELQLFGDTLVLCFPKGSIYKTKLGNFLFILKQNFAYTLLFYLLYLKIGN